MTFNIVPGFLVDFLADCLGSGLSQYIYTWTGCILKTAAWLFIMFDFCYSLCHAFSPDHLSLSLTVGPRVQRQHKSGSICNSQFGSAHLLLRQKKSSFVWTLAVYTIWHLGQKTVNRLFQLILCLYTLLHVHNVMDIAHLESMFPGHLAIPVIIRSPDNVWSLGLEFRKEASILT